MIIVAAGAVQASDWDFGVRLGLNQTTLTNTYESDGVNALTAGLYAANKLGSFFGIDFELAYTNRKTDSREDYRNLKQFYIYQDDYDNRQDYILSTLTDAHYIDLDALLKLFLPDYNRISPYVYGGPVVSLLVDGHKTATRRSLETVYNMDSPKFVGGYAIGAGFDFNFKGFKSSVDIRMTKAVTKIANYEVLSPAINHPFYNYDPSYKSDFISATIGIGFLSK